MAEAIFDHKITQKGLKEAIKSDSCGTSDYHIGELPDERTLQCATGRGILLDHRGRQLNRLDLQHFDYLIAMDQNNLQETKDLMKKYGLAHNNLYLMREFQPEAAHPDVPDPYYGGSDGFDEVYDILDESLDYFLEKLINEHHLNV